MCDSSMLVQQSVHHKGHIAAYPPLLAALLIDIVFLDMEISCVLYELLWKGCSQGGKDFVRNVVAVGLLV